MPALPSAAEFLQESLLPAVLPAALPSAAPGDPHAASPASKHFTKLLGSLIDEPVGTQQTVSTKKSPTTASGAATTQLAQPTPPAQPIAMPAVLRIHFLITNAAPANQTQEDSDESRTEATAQQTTVETPIIPVAQPVTVAAPGHQQFPRKLGTTPTSDRPATPQQAAAATPSAPAAIPSAPMATPAAPMATTPSPTPTQSAPTAQDVHIQAGPSTRQQDRPSVDSAADKGTTARAPAPSIKLPVAESAGSVEPPQLTVDAQQVSTPLQPQHLAITAKLTIVPTPQPVSPATTVPHVSAPVPAPKSSSPSQAEAPVTPPAAATPTNANTQQNANQDSSPNPEPPKSAAKVAAKPQPESQAESREQPAALTTAVASQAINPPATQVAAAQPSPVTAKPEAHAPPGPIDSRPAIAAIPAANSAQKPEPLRDLSIRVSDGPGKQVDVKIQERAGTVQVAVLSSSPTLTADIREQAGELTAKLDRAGYHAEILKPSTSLTSAQTQNPSDSGQQQGSSGGDQQQQQSERQPFSGRQRKSNSNQWLQHMDGSLNTTAIEGIDTK